MHLRNTIMTLLFSTEKMVLMKMLIDLLKGITFKKNF